MCISSRWLSVSSPPALTVVFETQPMIALNLIRQVVADGVSPATVLGDEVYGASSELWRGLRALNLEYCLNVGGDLLAWTQPVKARRGSFPVEPFFQRGKFNLGLDHNEGRSWGGFHQHLVLAAVAYLFVTVVFLESKKSFWCYLGAGPESDDAVARTMDRTLPLLPN